MSKVNYLNILGEIEGAALYIASGGLCLHVLMKKEFKNIKFGSILSKIYLDYILCNLLTYPQVINSTLLTSIFVEGF